MNMKVKKYITHNLNEATYLILKGFKYKSKAITGSSATFTFTYDPVVERYRKEFWTNGCRVNVHSWLSVRQALKDELRSQLMNETISSTEKQLRKIVRKSGGTVVKPESFQPKIGQTYWLCIGGTLLSSTFSEKGHTHKERAEQGMCYRTKDEALLAYKLGNQD